MMLRVKAMVVIPGNQISERCWRNSRGVSLVKFLARHRMTPRHCKEGRDHLKRIILEDIVPDCGWPRMGWLKENVRREMGRIGGFRRMHRCGHPDGFNMDKAAVRYLRRQAKGRIH